MLFWFFALVVVVNTCYRLNVFLQNDNPSTAYYQSIAFGKVYTATDDKGNSIEYLHPDLSKAVAGIIAIISLIIGRLWQ